MLKRRQCVSRMQIQGSSALTIWRTTERNLQWKDTEIRGYSGCDLSVLCLLGECDAV